MRARASSLMAVVVAAGVATGIWALTTLPTAQIDRAETHFLPLVAAIAAVALVVVVWRVDPAYTLSAAILLTPLAGNWPELGVPGPLSPDRLLLAGGILAVLLRAPPVADRPRLIITPVHWVLALASVYAVASAFFAGTLDQRDASLKLVDAFGIMPFLVFLVAPVAFRTPQQRRVLLGTLVTLGAYLGLTVLFEMAKLDALVFPKYILDPNYGIHSHRGRGPFVDAVANGLALYTCGVACAIAVATWRSAEARALAIAVGILCAVGCLLSLERSVWIGAVLGTTIAMLLTRGLRRYFVPVIVTAAAAIVIALVSIPGLEQSVTQRSADKGPIWDRRNLNRAAINMVDAKPLFGFGWSRFTSDSADYFQQAFDYPLTATQAGVHNTPLTYAVELGLVGVAFWLVGLVVGVGSALTTRGPPELMRWRTGLVAIATASVVVMNSVPPTAWLNRSIWLFAGVVYSGRYLATDTAESVAWRASRT